MKTEMKKCGSCGKEIKGNEYFQLWNATKSKLVMMLCKKCFEDKKVGEHIKKVLS